MGWVGEMATVGHWRPVEGRRVVEGNWDVSGSDFRGCGCGRWPWIGEVG
jgi:hypothetical protein